MRGHHATPTRGATHVEKASEPQVRRGATRAQSRRRCAQSRCRDHRPSLHQSKTNTRAPTSHRPSPTTCLLVPCAWIAHSPSSVRPRQLVGRRCPQTVDLPHKSHPTPNASMHLSLLRASSNEIVAGRQWKGAQRRDPNIRKSFAVSSPAGSHCDRGCRVAQKVATPDCAPTRLPNRSARRLNDQRLPVRVVASPPTAVACAQSPARQVRFGGPRRSTACRDEEAFSRRRKW